MPAHNFGSFSRWRHLREFALQAAAPVLVTAAVLMPAPASAQVAPRSFTIEAATWKNELDPGLSCTAPDAITPATHSDSSPTEELAKLYYKANWKGLKDAIKQTITACHYVPQASAKRGVTADAGRNSTGRAAAPTTSQTASPTTPQGASSIPTPDPYDAFLARGYLVVLFPSTVAKKDAEFLQVILHGTGDVPYTIRIPHDTAAPVTFVFISARESVKLRVTLQGTKVDNKLQTQLSSFLGKLPVTTFLPVPLINYVPLDIQRALTQARQPNQGPPVNVFIGVEENVALPDRPATITENDDASLPPGKMSTDDVATLEVAYAKVRADQLQQTGVCAKALASEIVGDAAKGTGLDAVLIPQSVAGSLWPETEKQIQSAITTVVDGTRPAACPAATKIGDKTDDGPFARTADTVASAFISALKQPEDVKVSSSVTIDNSALTRFEFTALSGVIVHEFKGSQPQVKINNGVFQDNSPLRGLTAIGVAWHPVAYDSVRTDLTKAESFSIVLGPTLVPDPGVALAASVKPFPGLKGLAFNVGIMSLIVPTVPKNLNVGDPVPKPSQTTDPNQLHVRTGWQTGWFIGFNYSFGS